MLQLDRLGQALRWLRLHSKLRQREVAERAGITSSMLSSYESGKKAPTLATLSKILQAMECSLLDLVHALELVDDGKVSPGNRRVVGSRLDEPHLLPAGSTASLDLDSIFAGSRPLDPEERRAFGEMLSGYCRWMRFLRESGERLTSSMRSTGAS